MALAETSNILDIVKGAILRHFTQVFIRAYFECFATCVSSLGSQRDTQFIKPASFSRSMSLHACSEGHDRQENPVSKPRCLFPRVANKAKTIKLPPSIRCYFHQRHGTTSVPSYTSSSGTNVVSIIGRDWVEVSFLEVVYAIHDLVAILARREMLLLWC